MDVTSKETITDFVFGLGLFNADNVCVYGTNTNLEEFQPTEIDGDGIVTFTIDKLDLVEGTYRLDLAAHKADGYPYDYHRLLLHVPREITHPRCRHLPSRSLMVVRREQIKFSGDEK